MYQWITDIIKAVTGFLGEFSKLNNVKSNAIKTFFFIVVILAIGLFFSKLLVRDDLYDLIIRVLISRNPISIIVIIAGGMWLYSIYSQHRMMKTVSKVLNDSKKLEKKHDEECYAQTSRIEEEGTHLTEYLREVLHADVVTVEMLHNQVQYDGGLHKRFYDECFPSVNIAEDVVFDAKEYQNVPTNLFPIITYIEKEKFKFFSTINELYTIDPGFARIMKDHNTSAIGIRFIKTKNNKPLGNLTVSWNNDHINRVPEEEFVREKMIEVGAKFEALLDMNQYYN